VSAVEQHTLPSPAQYQVLLQLQDGWILFRGSRRVELNRSGRMARHVSRNAFNALERRGWIAQMGGLGERYQISDAGREACDSFRRVRLARRTA
jgi:ribosomal protein S19E (S16A)